jgi:pimeloyl-ACP methyl ester carboxylesterase
MWKNGQLMSRYGESLALSVSDAAPGAPTVVMFPGFTGRRLNSTNMAIAAKLVPLGVRCVAGDLSGHGDSGGDIRKQSVIKASREIEDVLGYVRKTYLLSGFGRLGLLGNSFSANAAILAAARIPDLGALALKSPVTEYVAMRWSQLGTEQMRRWRTQGWIKLPDGTISDHTFIKDANSVDTYAELAKVTAPVFAVHGSADEEIPARSRERLAKEMVELGMTYRLVEGGDHSLSDPHFHSVTAILARFLADSLRQNASSARVTAG